MAFSLSTRTMALRAGTTASGWCVAFRTRDRVIGASSDRLRPSIRAAEARVGAWSAVARGGFVRHGPHRLIGPDPTLVERYGRKTSAVALGLHRGPFPAARGSSHRPCHAATGS